MCIAVITTQDRPYFYTNTNSRITSVAVQNDGMAAVDEVQKSPSPDGSNSLGVIIGTVTGVVICAVVAVAVFSLVAYHFKKRHGCEKNEKIPLMGNTFGQN